MQQQQPPPSSGYRPIVPAPPTPQAFVPITPHHSPSTHPTPHHSPLAHPNPQQGVVSLPFETPPVSPFSHPIHNDYAGQFKLPPPLQPLMLPISPAAIMSQQQNCASTPRTQQSSQSPSQSRYERILPKQSGPSTSVFPIPINSSTGGSSIQGGTRPAMQHHTSVIHPVVPHHPSYRSVSSDKPLTTADQRELARKVSHSAIERRRRERINDKIMQLKELIPSCADQDHLHKLNILQSAIEYIQYLQGIVTASRQREKDGKDDDRSSEEGRLVKRSKFDRYDILPPNSNSRKFESLDDREEYKHKRNSVSSASSSSSSSDQVTTGKNVTSGEEAKTDNDSTTSTTTNTVKPTTPSSSSPISHDHEDAKALLMLSNSESSITKELVKHITTKDSETQTSPPHAWEPSQESDSQESDNEQESPRRGMAVQQLLC